MLVCIFFVSIVLVMKSLVKYLEESFAIRLSLQALSPKILKSLPLYLRANYTFYDGHIQNRHIIFAEPAEDASLTPDQKQKQAKSLRELFKLPIVFILNNLEPWERKRLIGRNIAFVQPGKQLYIPELLLDLSDVKHTQRSALEKKQQLSYRTQLALLYHLEVKSIENTPLKDIALVLNYSAMNVSRIVREFEQHHLITIQGTKEKQIIFNQKQSQKLWSDVEPLMTSPVREIWFSDENPDETTDFILSNGTALSHYSDINEGKIKNYAIGKQQFKNLKSRQNISLDPQFGNIRIEVWHYDPRLLTKKNTVDPLSLYLSMRNEEDERLKMALDQMKSDIKW